MFRKTSPAEIEIFTSPSSLFGKRAAKKYDAPTAWHNMLFKLVTSQIDESVFQPLFKDNGMGAPNASIRILVANVYPQRGFRL